MSTITTSPTDSLSSPGLWRLFALKSCLILAALIGAFLLFQLEPLTGKIVTPRFGGTAGVWSVCLFFFQVIVLTGYGLTLGLSRLSDRAQIVVYALLVALSLFLAQIPNAASWSDPSPVSDPSVQVVCLLVRYVALPCLILSTVSGMTQLWYRRATQQNPYPLYSVSNVGSLGALLAYPTLFEPLLTVSNTLNIWRITYAVLVGILLLAAAMLFKIPSSTSVLPTAAGQERPTIPIDMQSRLLWTGLSMCGTLTLMSFTAYVTSDIAPVPLLWVLPLALYLFSFVLVFANERFYRPWLMVYTWPIIASIEPTLGNSNSLWRVGLTLVLIFIMCMICHGELATIKPHPKHLPEYYFFVSLGGMLGGVLIAFVAPLLLACDLDRWLTMAALGTISAVVMWNRKLFLLKNPLLSYVVILIFWSVLICQFRTYLSPLGLMYRERNFYGTVEVRRTTSSIRLVHGRILHGEQLCRPALAHRPTTYYGHAIQFLDQFLRERPPSHPLNVGVVGLGVGTMAAYGRKGDQINFFELDPKIIQIAQRHFSFLSSSPAKIALNLGDGRALLRQWHDKPFDLLLIDAFNGDAVPLHMLTIEALKIYAQDLQSDGLLVFHLTNRFANLVTPVANAGAKLGLASLLISVPEHSWKYLVFSRHQSTIDKLQERIKVHGDDFEELEFGAPPRSTKIGYWTDDFANIFTVLE